jgi:hypothetical protein
MIVKSGCHRQQLLKLPSRKRGIKRIESSEPQIIVDYFTKKRKG